MVRVKGCSCEWDECPCPACVFNLGWKKHPHLCTQVLLRTCHIPKISNTFLHNFALPWKRILFLPCCCMRKVLVFVAWYSCFCIWIFFYSIFFTGRKRSQSSWLSMFPSQLMLSSASFKFNSSWFFISRRIALLPLHDCMAMSWPCMFNVLEFCCWARHYGLRVFVPIYLFVLCVFLLLFLGFQLYYLVRMGTSPRIGFPV